MTVTFATISLSAKMYSEADCYQDSPFPHPLGHLVQTDMDIASLYIHLPFSSPDIKEDSHSHKK